MLDDSGEPMLEYAKQSCYFFDDLGQAKAYCNELVMRKDHIRCEIYDERGLAVEPIYTIVNSKHAHRVSNRKSVRLMIVASVVVTLLSIPLFWYDWKAQGARIWPTILGINLIVLGLRFLYWGYGELEHIRHMESEQRLAEAKSQSKV
jgi:hypothetical protein